MNQEALISVIVPVYKVEAFLPRCVDSILAQTYKNLEILLVDDGSPDRSGEICEEYARKDTRVRVIHKENGGLSSARNAGIDVAGGDYVAFVDSDDWIEPDAYEAMMVAMQKHGVQIVCAGRYDVDSTDGHKDIGLCPEREEIISSVELVGRIFHWEQMDSSAVDKLCARSLFNGIRYPVGRVVEDVPTTYRVMLRTDRIALIPKPIYNYYHRPQSISTEYVVTEKTFHFSDHAALVYADICAHFPELESNVHYLLVKAWVNSVLMVDLEGGRARKNFPKQYAEGKAYLKANMDFILHYPLFSVKDKIQAIMLAYGIYPAYRLFCRIIHRN